MTIECGNFELAHRYTVGEFRFNDDFHLFMVPQTTLFTLLRIFVWLSVCTNSANFWCRKCRIIGLSDGQKYFGNSLNTKLQLEHFSVYFSSVPWTGHTFTTLQMSVSSHARLCEYHDFISLENCYTRYICSFRLLKLTNRS